MRGWICSARATAATMKSVCVTFTPCDFSTIGIHRSRVALSAVASTSRVTKKCGTVVQLWVVRSAMMRPMELTASGGPDEAATGPDGAAEGDDVGLAEAAGGPAGAAEADAFMM